MSHVPGRSSRQLAIVALALIGMGAILRLAKFLQNPGLWVDEAMIAVNVGRRSFAQLAEPLDYIQLAPVPWLWLEKLLVEIGGMQELVLRTRLSAAKALLAEEELSIAAVARQVGYEDPAYFSRLFAARTGESPRAFRRSGSFPGPISSF